MSALMKNHKIKNMHKMYYPQNSLIFVHRIYDVMYHSESNEELTPGHVVEENTNKLLQQIFLHTANHCFVAF